jgi:hypothetical protein
VIDASGASRVLTPAATLAAYRPALILITAVAAAGTLVALSGLRRRRLAAGPEAGLAIGTAEATATARELDKAR